MLKVLFTKLDTVNVYLSEALDFVFNLWDCI